MSMRISELSATTGVPVATIKFYLREGLLPAGRSTAATQADYDDEHAARLRLVRALVEAAGLPLAAVHSVLAALDASSPAAAVAAAHEALSATPTDVSPDRAATLVSRLGWSVNPGSAALRQLELALAGLEAVGLEPSTDALDTYAGAALTVAARDIAEMPDLATADVVRFVVLGTVLYEPVLLALRRLAQQHAYAHRPGRSDLPADRRPR